MKYHGMLIIMNLFFTLLIISFDINWMIKLLNSLQKQAIIIENKN